MTTDEMDRDELLIGLCGEVAMLRKIVESIIRELPEETMANIVKATQEEQTHIDRMKEISASGDVEAFASGASDMRESLGYLTQQWLEERREGLRFNTVQPASSRD